MYSLILMINVYFFNVNCAYIITLFSGAVHLLFCVCSLISFVEFQAFESLLCAPDAISQLSFKLFDVDQSGKVSYGKSYNNYVLL